MLDACVRVRLLAVIVIEWLVWCTEIPVGVDGEHEQVTCCPENLKRSRKGGRHGHEEMMEGEGERGEQK